jgi:tetratricopeptide (TPR) repeat protein
MNESRIATLKAYLKEDPDDAFTLYALALEYRQSEPERTLQYFEQLLSRHAGYMGTYYHAAQLYHELGQVDKARQTYEKGIALAQKENEHLALRELQNAYNNFLLEEE